MSESIGRRTLVVLQSGSTCPLRQRMTSWYQKNEQDAVDYLLVQLSFWDELLMQSVHSRAYTLVAKVREAQKKVGGINALMNHYDLSSEEGILLMCLAEALLRVPDKTTEASLIRDKLLAADWDSHKGSSASSFVNLATLGLSLTGRVLRDSNQSNYLTSMWKRLTKRIGAPVIRYAIRDAMGVLSKQFVLGQTIEEAIKHSAAPMSKGYRYSYDMLGEVARTEADAQQYFQAYANAIMVLGKQNASNDVHAANSISVKLSALYPRYEFSQQQTAVPVLVQRLGDLALMAKSASISLTMDAEEADRLDMSLDIFKAVFELPALSGWNGFGLAVQAYQKRASMVIDWLIDLAKRNNKTIQVRLVKGAYWDSEIKWAQALGVSGYPVYTRKISTDVNYIHCADKMLQATDYLYSQFATHNAHTVASVLELVARYQVCDYEFQNLQGMGRSLHDELVAQKIPSRIYAPVGTHEDLLPYLVRRLLENGANCSFVNRIVDERYGIDDLIADPIRQLRLLDAKANPRIPLPRDIYSNHRKNAHAPHLSNWSELLSFRDQLHQAAEQFSIDPDFQHGQLQAIEDPATGAQLSTLVHFATKEEAKEACTRAQHAFSSWSMQSLESRAAVLYRLADLLEENLSKLVYAVMREAGRILIDAIDDVREAIDFCRYYAAHGLVNLAAMDLQGITGESNRLSYVGRGVMLCISPWNFPVAIFTGQVVAALMAGNTVIAKPAEQTPLSACLITSLLYEAGLPRDVLHTLPGDGVLGAYMVSSLPHSGVVFTGSNAAAWSIHQALASRRGEISPLIAETGGINAMVSDSTALPEQLVFDAMQSAFGSAGQRCSALRVLFVQQDIADEVLEMFVGAMKELKVGDPLDISTDVGPVIDADAAEVLRGHIDYLESHGRCIARASLSGVNDKGHFIAPCIYLLDDISLLKQEVFGPILHVVCYNANALDQVIEQVNEMGYGLTFGISTRIDEVVDYLTARIRAGNFYVNRSMTGAVVGVQPFGGCGLSGTGPKAGGPNYLKHLSREVSISINTTASGGNAALMSLED